MSSLRSRQRMAAYRMAFRVLGETTEILGHDLQANVAELFQALERSAAGEPRSGDFNFYLKAAIRTLFGLAEVVNNSMATALLQSDISLRNSDRAVLMECDYDAERDICLTEDGRHYPLGRRLQVCFHLFPIACGSSPLPDWDSAIRKHFRDISQARNRFTHPTRLENLYPIPVFESFRQVVVWFPGEVTRVLRKAAQGLGLPLSEPPSIPAIQPFPVPMPRPDLIFDEDFYHQVFANPSAAIRYIGFFSSHLDEELKRTFSLCSAALELPYRPKIISRAVREMVRAITTNAEGAIGFTSFFMRAVRRSRAKVLIPQRVRGESVPDRLVRTLTAFSEAFGEGHPIEQNEQWHAFCSAFNLRDRLTHPKSAEDLNLDSTHLDVVFSALKWFHDQATPAIFLNEGKIGDCFGSRRPLKKISANPNDKTNTL